MSVRSKRTVILYTFFILRLIEALENGTIAGAGLDVQETEPPEENSPLYTMDQVLLTPHMGWKGLETRQRLVSILADNIKQFMEGNPINVVSGLLYLAAK